MNENGFVDYYELLQLSPNADTDTIERVFRHLAKKTHPDNKDTANPEQFRWLVEAHRILTNPETRAAYDIRYQEHWNDRWKLMSEAGNGTAFNDSKEVRESLLSLLYVQRRRDPRRPGLSDFDMARLLGKPFELVEFHIWYLKEKGWVDRLDTGHLAISALGVDQVEQGQLRLRNDHLLTDGKAAPGQAGKKSTSSDSAELIYFPGGPDSKQ